MTSIIISTFLAGASCGLLIFLVLWCMVAKEFKPPIPVPSLPVAKYAKHLLLLKALTLDDDFDFDYSYDTNGKCLECNINDQIYEHFDLEIDEEGLPIISSEFLAAINKFIQYKESQKNDKQV